MNTNKNKKSFTLAAPLIVAPKESPPASPVGSTRNSIANGAGRLACRRGFTLLELLIVIGILAILSTVAILIINPAELLRRSRDASRISDLRTLKAAIGLFMTEVTNPNLGPSTCGALAISSVPAAGGTTTTLASNCNPSAIGSVRHSAAATYMSVTGNGWIEINFNRITGGSPLASLPIDPTNRCETGEARHQLYYTYSCQGMNFLLTARLESAAYVGTAATGYGPMAKDGGTATSVYEVGTIYTIPGGATTSYGLWAI